MTRKLHIADDLALPTSAVTETFGLLAVRGAGKTNAARALAEEMFAAGLPFVVVDPVGSWTGLRSSRDGKGPGLPIPIFGGRLGDVPLERTAGSLIADLIVDKRLSCVLDVSDFDSEAARKQFLHDFARRLYARNEQPLHVFCEEADDYIPQSGSFKGIDGQLLRAWENLVRRGRARGIGVTLITQRSASINKSVLTQVQTLIALRTTGPQDRKAIEGWLKYHAQSDEIMESLPSLADGEAWIWSPNFLHLTKRFRFRLSHTFDSGATPKVGVSGKRTTLADVDLGAIEKEMAATRERAKASDPKLLRAELARVKAELAKAQKAVPVAVAPPAKVKRVEVPVVLPAGIAAVERCAKAVERRIEQLDQAKAEAIELRKPLNEIMQRMRMVMDASGPARPVHVEAAAIASVTRPMLREMRRSPRETNGAGGEQHLGGGMLATLKACAMYADGVTREQLTVLTGYKRSTRNAYVNRLQQAGLVVERNDERIVATERGRTALGADYEPLPTGDELLQFWLRRLPEGERAVLAALVASHPDGVERESLTELTGYKRSTRNAYLNRLGAKRLVESEGGTVRASAELFDA